MLQSPITPAASQHITFQHKPKILVVGATGFLDSKIQLHLEQDAAIDLRAMSRRGAPAGSTAAVEWVRGDLIDPERSRAWMLLSARPTAI